MVGDDELVRLKEEHASYQKIRRDAAGVFEKMLVAARKSKAELEQEHAGLKGHGITLVDAVKQYGGSRIWLQKAVEAGWIAIIRRGSSGPGHSTLLDACDTAIAINLYTKYSTGQGSRILRTLYSESAQDTVNSSEES